MRLKTLHAGVILLKIFVISLIADMGLLTAFLLIHEKNYIIWGISAGSVILIEGAVFWTGIILTYSTSVQLGIRTRVLGIVLGWIPVAHLIMLIMIIKVCSAEVRLVKYFDGENDGLVGSQSFPWGENTVFLRNEKGSRGISHGDVIDLNRENIEGFDVREFYVQLVSNLRKKGM